MAILLRVKWVDKSDETNSYRRVQLIGGNSRELHWKHSLDQAIRAIEEGIFAYYIRDDRVTAQLSVAVTPSGEKYLKTEVDSGHPCQLIKLPSFPTRTSAQAR